MGKGRERKITERGGKKRKRGRRGKNEVGKKRKPPKCILFFSCTVSDVIYTRKLKFLAKLVY